MRPVYFWQHQLLQRGWWALNKLVMEFVFNVIRLVIWARNWSYLVYCMNWTCRTHRKVTAELPKRQDSPSSSCFTEETARHSAGHRRKQLTDFAIQSKTNPQFSCFTEKSARYYGLIDWRWMSQCYKRTLGDCPGSEMFLSFLKLWKLFTKHFLFI